MDIEQIIEDINAKVDALHVAADPEQRAVEREAALADYGETGRWRFAPDSERRKALAAIDADQQRRIDESGADLGAALLSAEPELDAALKASQAPPDPYSAFQERHGVRSTPLETVAIIDYLSRLLEIQLAPQIAAASPSARLARYERALSSHDDAVQRLIEHADPPLPTTDPQELAAQARLTKRIQETRAARVPPHLKDAQEAVKRARRAYQRATDLHRLQPRRRSA